MGGTIPKQVDLGCIRKLAEPKPVRDAPNTLVPCLPFYSQRDLIDPECMWSPFLSTCGRVVVPKPTEASLATASVDG